MLRLFAGLGLTALSVAASSDGINVVCNKDNTIDVTIEYDQKVEVLEFKYGDCDKTSSRANFTQNSKFGWDFSLDVTACNMDNKLRTLEYNQTAFMRVGRKSAGTELSFATFDIQSYCTYTSSYTVKFDYGSLTSESHVYKSDAGLINLTFSLKSYTKDYTAEETHSTQAGNAIFLGLKITNDKFNHASDVAAGKTGKVFAPQSCTVSDTNGNKYTLFDHTVDSCANADVDLTISFSQGNNMWKISHTLFLIGNHRTSKLSLECNVIVCDRSGDASACDAVVKACETPVDGVIAWGQYKNCSVACGGGFKNRTGTCTPPSFFGKACGDLSSKTACNDQPCPHPTCAKNGQGIHVDDPNCKDFYQCDAELQKKDFQCPSGNYWNKAKYQCQTEVPSTCKHPTCDGVSGGYYVANDVCEDYYKCTTGFRKDFKCESGKYFDLAQQTCGTKVPSGCQDPRCKNLADGTWKVNSKCQEGYSCASGHYTGHECTNATLPYFNEATKACEAHPPTDCFHPTCKSKGVGTHVSTADCRGYVQCKYDGAAMYFTEHSCPEGQQMNGMMTRCEAKKQPGCPDL